MTREPDIVQRLRSLNDGNRWPMMDEAAAEIERLRRLLEIALDAYEDVASDPNIGKPGHFVTQARAAMEPKP